MKIQEAITSLKQVSDFTPEFEHEDAVVSVQDPLKAFLATYPQLQRYPDYLDFLRLTGGAFIDSPHFSLALYGFGGDVVTSFNEPRLFLDRDRYFHFADVVYPERPDLILVFAFDFRDKDSTVYVSEDGVWQYEYCASSFAGLLSKFADGALPSIQHE